MGFVRGIRSISETERSCSRFIENILVVDVSINIHRSLMFPSAYNDRNCFCAELVAGDSGLGGIKCTFAHGISAFDRRIVWIIEIFGQFRAEWHLFPVRAGCEFVSGCLPKIVNANANKIIVIKCLGVSTQSGWDTTSALQFNSLAVNSDISAKLPPLSIFAGLQEEKSENCVRGHEQQYKYLYDVFWLLPPFFLYGLGFVRGM